MNLLDIVTVRYKGRNIQRSPIFINPGGCGLDTSQKNKLVETAIMMQQKQEEKRGFQVELPDIEFYSGIIESKGEYYHPILGFSGQRYTFQLNYGPKGVVDFMICPSSRLTCDTASIPTEEERHRGYVDEAYGGYEPTF